MAACSAILETAQAAITFNSASFPTCYGPCTIAGDLTEYLGDNGMDHLRGAPKVTPGHRTGSRTGPNPQEPFVGDLIHGIKP